MTKVIFIVVAFAVALLAVYVYNDLYPFPEEFFYNTTQFIIKAGYRSEEHEIETDDGFIITLFRILPKVGSPGKIPVVFVGGVICSSSSTIQGGPGQALPYLMVDEGIDVWLYNDRGTVYSRPSAKIKIKALPYDFGFEETGTNELRHTIDFIMDETDAKKVSVYCVSAGGNTAFALLEAYPNYNEKIGCVLNGGPALSFNTTKFASVAFSTGYADYPQYLKWIPIFEPYFLRKIVVRLIARSTYFTDITTDALGIPGSGKDATRRFEITIMHAMNTNVYGFIQHIAQMTRGSEFRKRSFGAEANLQKYNSTIPPLFDVSKITAPVRLYYSTGDGIIGYELIFRVHEQLKNYLGAYMLKEPFSHVDFILNNVQDKDYVRDVIQTVFTMHNNVRKQ